MDGEYNLLEPEKPDQERVRQYAKLLDEIDRTERKLAQLNELKRLHKRLKKHVWRTNMGQHLAITDLGDDHIRNIVGMLERTYQEIPSILRDEAVKRQNLLDITAAPHE